MFEGAVDVLGQPNFISDSGGAPNQKNLRGPRGAVAVSAAGKIYVPDSGHSRVLVFPAGAGADSLAEFVLGQPDFTTEGETISQGKHPQAAHVAIAAGRMAVAEPYANRISLYSSVPTSATQVPDGLLGQHAFDGTLGSCNRRTMLQPESVAMTPGGNKLLVADTGNSRVIVYNSFPVSVGSAPWWDISLGQTHVDCFLPAVPSAASMNQPKGVWTDGNRVVVADTGNNRVLLWETFPNIVSGSTIFGEPAHRVLGQSNFSSVLANRGATTPGAETLKGPTHVASDGTRLAVADTGNHRVLIWNTFPTADGADADVVLGQSAFNKMFENDSDQVGGSDNPSEFVFFTPTGLLFHDGKLYVSDRGNNRVLIFDGR